MKKTTKAKGSRAGVEQDAIALLESDHEEARTALETLKERARAR